MTVNIVNFAKANKSSLLETYEKIVSASHEKSVIPKFQLYLSKNLKVSVNSEHQKLLNIIKGKAYLSSYELTGDYNEAIKHYGSRKDYRVIIDTHFENGKLFKYFALNGGNMGVPLWGPYCIIFELSYFDIENTVLLKRNSLDKINKDKYYYFDGTELNEKRFISDLAIITDAKKLCIVKHGQKINSIKNKDWAELICKCKNIKFHNETNYIELITHQRCNLDNNFLIRMRKDRILTLAKSIREKKIGKKIKGLNILQDEFEDLKILQKNFALKFELV